MRWIGAALIAALLAACGADGEPVPPTRNATITLTDSGAAVRTEVTQGPVSVSLGLGF